MFSSELKQVLSIIPLFSDLPFSAISIQQLAGLTNKNYLLSTTRGQYVLRIPRESGHLAINRNYEALNHTTAQHLGLAPEVLWREKDEHADLTGTSLCVYLADSEALTLKGTNSLKNPLVMDQIANSLRTLQNNCESLKGVLDVSITKKLLQHYFNLCHREQQSVFQQDYQVALQLLTMQEHSSLPLVPSHVDLVLENILIEKATEKSTKADNINARYPKIRFIDWEYSAMASPFWDLAVLSNAASLTECEAELFLKKVFSHCQSDDVVTLKHYRVIVKVVSACWHGAYS